MGIDVSFKGDDAFVDKVFYCKIEFVEDVDIRIRNVEGEELLFLKHGQDGVNVSFFHVRIMGFYEVAEFPDGMNVRRKIIETFYSYKLIQRNGLNLAGVKNFLKAYPIIHPVVGPQKGGMIVYQGNQPPENIVPGYTYLNEQGIVWRDKQKPVQISTNKVYQDSRQIATFLRARVYDPDGILMERISIVMMTGQPIAEIFCFVANEYEYEVNTLNDNQKHSFKLPQNPSAKIEQLCNFLVSLGYL